MADNKPELKDFDGDDDAPQQTSVAQPMGVGLGTHAAVGLGGFKDFCIKAELMRAIAENGFEHPSEVQHRAIPEAMLGTDILAQAKAGMGKTAVFVFALLEQIAAPAEKEKPTVQAVIVVHARELAHQILREFNRFNKYLPHCTANVFYGGVPIEQDVKTLKTNPPAIVVGTPGRLSQLVQQKALNLKSCKYFVCDEFDRCLDEVKMRRDVQTVFLATPKEKQVMMFSATMTAELRATALKFMNKPKEILVDSQAKLTLHGLTQFFINLEEKDKMRRLCELLDKIEFNQVIIFTKSVERCQALRDQLRALQFPAASIHSAMPQGERLKVYEECKQNNTRIIVATDLFGRGIDIDKINLVVQFDMASDPDTYLHRVGRAGRFGTKGLTVAFIVPGEQELKREKRTYVEGDIMKTVQERFEAKVTELTDIATQLDHSQYMNQ
uniref:RNA helicase n=1 Tax=Neobodo designis TaxID=312471 RepID=A0A7S1LAQ1_NEODS|mmetsp:Transcript_16959/g.52655  ORF Transcript_16959/g.52655 Transcript_16959/m.52655 type:complete len:440 (+) Transcript_16959:40-1359(+)|eukprot:CAMPEP_0174828836 /NCGR_PEP_ID=MMETSP1114-20130205/1559_1 /TAXON_ID=312471 /ORGANISM="Neobodo designis, Strain CCAP 1951/1" /LENGTH=439 /DNA_ID=CAMNT_0016062563 /DNA_START=40 /DNA_END=1359 /DNA_ORIENTATION=-